jgi:acyl-CoA synthetase (AMP-forming)/AMP-acid ligase II
VLAAAGLHTRQVYTDYFEPRPGQKAAAGVPDFATIFETRRLTVAQMLARHDAVYYLPLSETVWSPMRYFTAQGYPRVETVASYFKGEGGKILDDEGYFDTGDVATIDELGYMKITDRAKDVIKSGGEWISSIDLENIAIGHPDVAEAAVIGIAHPKWDERPLLIIIAKPGKKPSKSDILKFLDGKVAKWWMPDDVVFVDEIPHTATGKIQKMTLREKFRDYRLPTAAE